MRRFIFPAAVLVSPLVFAMGPVASAQFDNGSAANAAEQGASLGLLVDTVEFDAQNTRQVPCLEFYGTDTSEDAPEGAAEDATQAMAMTGLTCLLDTLGAQFVQPDQWDLLESLFAPRLSHRDDWPLFAAEFKGRRDQLSDQILELSAQTEDQAPTTGAGEPDARVAALPSDGAVPVPYTFAELADPFSCPSVEEGAVPAPGQDNRRWLTAPSGLRDLSPPIYVNTSAYERFLTQALGNPRALEVFLETPCTGLRAVLARGLFRAYLNFDEKEAAGRLAALPFMPARYARQHLGATQDADGFNALKTEVVDDLLKRQQALAAPNRAAEEVAVLLNEVERQFAIDYLLGRLWALDQETINALELDTAFVGEVARLLSQDAKLLQQGYGPNDVRLFYLDFFEVLAAKNAYDLMRGIDLLIPQVMAGEFDLTLSARPLNGQSPTRFERDQEVLAILIAGAELDAVFGVWDELASAQRRDAVLFALDQDVAAAAAALYARLEPEDMSVDFLVRLALYQAVRLPLQVTAPNLEIELDLQGEAQ